MDSKSQTAASSSPRPHTIGQDPTSRSRKDAYPPDSDMRLVQSAFHDMIENAKLQTSWSGKSQNAPPFHLALFIQPLTGPPACLSSQELPSPCKPYLPSIERFLCLILNSSGWRSDLIIWENTATIVIWRGAALASLEGFLQTQLEIKHRSKLKIVVPGGLGTGVDGYAESESIPVFRLTCRGASAPPNEQFEGPLSTPQIAPWEEFGDEDEEGAEEGVDDVEEDEALTYQNLPPPTPPIILLEEPPVLDGQDGVEDVEAIPDPPCQVGEPIDDSSFDDSFSFESLEEEQILPQDPLIGDESGTHTTATLIAQYHHLDALLVPGTPLIKLSVPPRETITSPVSLTFYITISIALSVTIATLLSSYVAFSHRQTFSFKFKDCFLTEAYPGGFLDFTDTECRLKYLSARIKILVKVLCIWVFSFCSITLASVVVWFMLWVRNRWGDLIKEMVWERLGGAFEGGLLDWVFFIE